MEGEFPLRKQDFFLKHSLHLFLKKMCITIASAQSGQTPVLHGSMIVKLSKFCIIVLMQIVAA